MIIFIQLIMCNLLHAYMMTTMDIYLFDLNLMLGMLAGPNLTFMIDYNMRLCVL
jgi:hypothetical protein